DAEKVHVLLSTVLALKAASEGCVFYSPWVSTFFSYGRAFGPQERMVILDATADFSAAALSDTIHVVEGVPQPVYDNLQIHLMHLEPTLRRALLPTNLNRSTAKKVYNIVLDLIRQHTGPGAKVLVYAKRDWLRQLDDEAGEKDTTIDGRTVAWVHFGSG